MTGTVRAQMRCSVEGCTARIASPYLPMYGEATFYPKRIKEWYEGEGWTVTRDSGSTYVRCPDHPFVPALKPKRDSGVGEWHHRQRVLSEQQMTAILTARSEGITLTETGRRLDIKTSRVRLLEYRALRYAYFGRTPGGVLLNEFLIARMDELAEQHWKHHPPYEVYWYGAARDPEYFDTYEAAYARFSEPFNGHIAQISVKRGRDLSRATLAERRPTQLPQHNTWERGK